MTDDPIDPFAFFARWYAEAEAAEPIVPDAMQLATVGPDGAPAIRTVLVKGAGPEGFVFFTNYESRKGAHLASDTRVAGCFHWKSLARQVLLEGVVERLSPEASDAYHALRPRGSQIGAWASDQSRPLGSRAELEARVAEISARYEGSDVPRPPHWGGYLLRPHLIEFWQGREDRLHVRTQFSRTDAGWSRGLLFP